jgi:hypothetical protein
MDVRYFGGTQEFISLGVYESSVLFAINNSYFNSDLDQSKWPSSVFQFYAGDLYDVIPALAKKFYPSDKISGSCVALEQGFSLVRGGPTYFNVTIKFNCSLGINRTKFTDFSVNTLWFIEGRPSNKYIDFVVKGVESKAVYTTYQEFEVSNRELADWMLESCLMSSKGSKVFGSGFKTHTRDYPLFEVHKDNYTFLYDSSHVRNERID